MLWLLESAQRMFGMGRRDHLTEREGRWVRDGTTHSKFYQDYLPDQDKRYSCVHCQAHLAFHNNIISKSFHGSQGRAYLFNEVVNVKTGPAEERVLLTGRHSVADIFCACCKTTLGWKYEFAFERSQKYKEGKFIIETIHMVKDNGWEQDLLQ